MDWDPFLVVLLILSTLTNHIYRVPLRTTRGSGSAELITLELQLRNLLIIHQISSYKQRISYRDEGITMRTSSEYSDRSEAIQKFS